MAVEVAAARAGRGDKNRGQVLFHYPDELPKTPAFSVLDRDVLRDRLARAEVRRPETSTYRGYTDPAP